MKDFPYSELEFTKPADTLIEAVEQLIIRTTGEKPTWNEIMKHCKKVLEARK